jgi:uncharacterized membrane protein (UPF0127 family)
MPKITLIFIFIFIGIIVYLYFPFKLKSKTIKINQEDFTVEIATTPSQLSRGLSNRKELCQNCGMLFVFPTPQILQFWMKDTLIPLDMIFIDKDKKIINIITASVGDLSLKNSLAPALYCLELNGGRALELNLKNGDSIEL